MLPNNDIGAENAILRRRTRSNRTSIQVEKEKQQQIKLETRIKNIRIKQLTTLKNVITIHECENVLGCKECERINENYYRIIHQEFWWVERPYILPVYNEYGSILYGIDRRSIRDPSKPLKKIRLVNQ